MTPALTVFLQAVRAGYVSAGIGGAAPDGTLADGTAPLAPTDPEAVTAEAYNQGVLDPVDTPWEEGLALVRAGLKEST